MIEIRAPKNIEEYKEACKLVEKVYVNHGYCDFLCEDEFASSILIALDEEKIVGTVGLRSAEDGKLPVEYYFGFDSEKVCPYKRSEVMEICKMASIELNNKLILSSLIAAICEYCKRDGHIEIAFASSKPDLINLLETRLHIPVHTIDSEVVEENVEGIYGRYFLDEPRPLPVSFIVKEADIYLSRLLKVIKNRVSISLDGFSHRTSFAESVK
jgi:hypothetical protein